MLIRIFWRSGCLLATALLAGCSTVHQVTVDAISDKTRPLGASYHLEVNDPTGGVDVDLQSLAVATIKDALSARGLYEVPARTRPDMVIQADYRVGHGHVKIVTTGNMDVLIGPSSMPNPGSKAVVVFDKTLELTAREPATPAGSGQPPKPGNELWSVKTKIVDTKQEIAPFLPALASAAIDYIGENPGREVTLPVDSATTQTLLQRRPAGPAAEPVVK